MPNYVILTCVRVDCATCTRTKSDMPEYSFVRGFYVGRGITLKAAHNEEVLAVSRANLQVSMYMWHVGGGDMK